MKIPGEASVQRAELIREVQELHGRISPKDIQQQFGLSKATFYRYLKVDLSKYER